MNYTDGIIVSVLASSAVDRWLEPRSGQIKDYKTGIWCQYRIKGPLVVSVVQSTTYVSIE